MTIFYQKWFQKTTRQNPFIKPQVYTPVDGPYNEVVFQGGANFRAEQF